LPILKIDARRRPNAGPEVRDEGLKPLGRMAAAAFARTASKSTAFDPLTAFTPVAPAFRPDEQRSDDAIIMRTPE
jgi:hypothetical protein